MPDNTNCIVWHIFIKVDSSCDRTAEKYISSSTVKCPPLVTGMQHIAFHDDFWCNRNWPNYQAVIKEIRNDKRRAESMDSPYFHANSIPWSIAIKSFFSVCSIPGTRNWITMSICTALSLAEDWLLTTGFENPPHKFLSWSESSGISFPLVSRITVHSGNNAMPDIHSHLHQISRSFFTNLMNITTLWIFPAF